MTEEEINSLLHCPKVIEEAPKKEMRVDRGSRRNDLRLRTKDGQVAFHVFIRQNEKFPENFSIGLDYLPQDGGRVPLLRCNGPHGEFVGNPARPHDHFLFHIHKATPENIEAEMRANHGGVATKAFASFRQALAFFLREVRVEDATKYFPAAEEQITFDLMGDGE